MKLADLIQGLPVTLVRGSGEIEVSEIVEDSRCATTGCLFVARPGTQMDGRRFVEDAVSRGAAAVLTNAPIETAAANAALAVLTCDDVRLQSARLAERFYCEPSNQLRVIGVTGTNGKTTVAYLVRHLLNSARMKCGLMGTVQIDDGAQVRTAHLTTPPAHEISRALRAMVDHGCAACVMETSSHALHQKRAAAVNFDVGVFTNLSGDHLDYHPTMEAYFDAKAALFESLTSEGHAIINIDDPHAEQLIDRSPAQFTTCSVTDRSADCFASVGGQTISYTEVLFSAPHLWGKIECRLPLIGRHNVMNALQAAAVGHALGLDRSALLQGIETCKAPPGRLEPVTGPKDEFAVLVDYAHTDDALENVLRSLRPVVPSGGKLRVIFGCGGDRDRTKRPRMAKVACRYADDIVITSDNPRTEDPEAIIDEVRAGVPHERLGDVTCIVDRAAAIHTAIERTAPGDIVLIAGKGHEDYQIIGTTKRPFDDRLVAAEALATRKTKAVAA